MTAFILLSLTAPRPAPTLTKPHYPLLCTITLASLVKGRRIDGKAQALILLLSACDMPTIFILQTFLPSRRRDCLISALCPAPTLPKPHYPTPRTKLASPRKRGGGTAVEVFRLAVQYSDSPAFTILKLFRTVTVGIVNALEAFMIALLSISISYAPHQPLQNRTIPPTFRRGGARSSRCIDPLHFYNICKRTLITCLVCPSRCTEPLHSHNPLKSTTIPRSAPILPKPHYHPRFS